jgi:sterol desaturase/sphingolipid hydroxylase (fatty acid hydroxylase superfamily)
MFQSNLLEAGSKVHPATPFILYGPLVAGLLVYGLGTGVTRPVLALGMFILGMLTWDAMEYAIHRAFFHWEGNGPLTRKLHDIVHGYHHKYPDDPLRAVMPIGASIPLALVIGGALYLVGEPAFTLPFFCGIVTGYMRYDFTHWYLHHRTPKTAWGKALRSHHLAHHFACPDKNFGISHRWIDVLLGSLRKR